MSNHILNTLDDDALIAATGGNGGSEGNYGHGHVGFGLGSILSWKLGAVGAVLSLAGELVEGLGEGLEALGGALSHGHGHDH
jgi:hypothetical protein